MASWFNINSRWEATSRFIGGFLLAPSEGAQRFSLSIDRCLAIFYDFSRLKFRTACLLVKPCTVFVFSAGEAITYR